MTEERKGNAKYGPNELGLTDEEIDLGLDLLRLAGVEKEVRRRQAKGAVPSPSGEESAPNDDTDKERDG